jgi:acetoin utilization deacetylase AcuC-like enzyme
LEITTDPDTYLDVVAEMLEHIGSVDLLLLNAGMDPADGGSAGSTRGFTSELLEAREQLVAEWCERTNTPVAFVLAGGYVGSGLTLGDVADLHVHTVAAIADATITR